MKQVVKDRGHVLRQRIPLFRTEVASDQSRSHPPPLPCRALAVDAQHRSETLTFGQVVKSSIL